jgi:hypothetical protein
MKQWLMVLAVAGVAGMVQAQNAAPAAPAAPAVAAAPAAGETLVFGFEDDAWKAGKFGAENGKITIAEENATEGKKALVLEFDRTGKDEGDRPTVRIDKVAAFKGAKVVLMDCTFVGEVSAKTKLRVQFKDTAKASASAAESLTEGKSTVEVDMTTCDANTLAFAKICLDNCKSGKGKIFIDNIRIKK